MHVKIHAPRKDQCDLCISHDLDNCDEDEYKAHIIRKTRGRGLKKQLVDGSDPDTLIISMNLQNILLCPKT